MPKQNNLSSCYLCNADRYEVIHEGTRDNAKINVLKCSNCGLVFLSEFTVNDNDYEKSKMHGEQNDFLKWSQETITDDLRRFDLLRNLIFNKSILDFGCGNGNFIKFASHIAKIAHGVELEHHPREVLNENGFKVFKTIEETSFKYDYITLFHVLEHLADPLDYLDQLKKYLNKDGKIVIEVPNSDDALLKLYNCKAFADFTYWSFHLFLYNENTLSLLAEKAGYDVEWKKQIQRYGLVNHLYWLSTGKPGGGATCGIC